MADAKMLKKVPVREQDPKVRATNFEEVLYPLIFLDLLKRLKRERSKKHTK